MWRVHHLVPVLAKAKEPCGARNLIQDLYNLDADKLEVACLKLQRRQQHSHNTKSRMILGICLC